MKALLIYFNEPDEKGITKIKAMVRPSDQAKQCAGSRAESFSIDKSEKDRSLTETLR